VCSGEDLGLVMHVHMSVFMKGVVSATELKSYCSTVFCYGKCFELIIFFFPFQYVSIADHPVYCRRLKPKMTVSFLDLTVVQLTGK
jgi:hypothetical protein